MSSETNVNSFLEKIEKLAAEISEKNKTDAIQEKKEEKKITKESIQINERDRI